MAFMVSLLVRYLPRAPSIASYDARQLSENPLRAVRRIKGSSVKQHRMEDPEQGFTRTSLRYTLNALTIDHSSGAEIATRRM